MRGRILAPFTAELAQLDSQATTVNAVLKEPTVRIDPVTGERTTGRAEKLTQVRCQVETGTFQAQDMAPTGDIPRSSLTLVMHFEDLEAAGLIGPENRPLINVNDRLVRILTEDGVEQQSFVRSPVYVTEATPAGFGFGGAVNLLVVRFGDRAQGVRGA